MVCDAMNNVGGCHDDGILNGLVGSACKLA